ncbi:MAG: hypothetical protein GTN36_05110, partial [Candidatus Aenigmarchaeota archaeon]|nr:hypothetical protein [Candidatus Aenigmarchaeota archaeon]
MKLLIILILATILISGCTQQEGATLVLPVPEQVEQQNLTNEATKTEELENKTMTEIENSKIPECL